LAFVHPRTPVLEKQCAQDEEDAINIVSFLNVHHRLVKPNPKRRRALWPIPKPMYLHHRWANVLLKKINPFHHHDLLYKPRPLAKTTTPALGSAAKEKHVNNEETRVQLRDRNLNTNTSKENFQKRHAEAGKIHPRTVNAPGTMYRPQ
jgi:hypothetical protein